MQYIPMTILTYTFDEATGETNSVEVAFSLYGADTFNARLTLTADYIKSQNEKHTLDNITKSQIDTYARRYMRDWVLVERTDESEA